MIAVVLGAAAILAATIVVRLAHEITCTNETPETYMAITLMCTIVILGALTALLLGGA